MNDKMGSLLLALALAGLSPLAGAAEAPKVVPALTNVQAIPLDSTGSPTTERWEETAGWRRAFNVTQPALYPFPPRPGTANGAAIVIAPGGGFTHLSMDSEGFKVAEYLAERGIAAFVLKYRVKPTRTPEAHMDAQADGLAAMKWVRSHAADYGIKANRIGFMGFSAGAMTTTNVALHYDQASRPDFIGVIYGGMADKASVPADAPPAFFAVAADDPLLGKAAIPMYEAWRAAGKDAELHVYAHGAHGFGMRPQGTSSDRWAEDYYTWLRTEILK